MGLATEEIKSKLNIVDLIGEYVRLQKAGSSWKACCPFHNEKTPSFTVSEEKQFWHCFGCGKGGDAFAFLMEIEGLDFKEALENLAERTGVELPKYKGGEKREDRNKIWEVLELATKFYEKQLWDGPGKNKILKYLQERGLNDETIREFRLGFAPAGWGNILDFLKSRGYNSTDILKAGLIIEKDGGSKQYDRFRDRIIFPICDVSGKVLGYSARVAPGGDESQAKYVNTPETEVYHKGNVLYGMHKAKSEIKEKDKVLLVEGNMDVIASYQAGIKNTVAVSGTALTPEQLKLIKRYTNNIKMFFDMDEAGQKASKRSSELAFENEMNVFVVEITEGKDAADAVKENPANFLSAVRKALPAMEYFLQKEMAKRNKNNIEDKKKIIEELADLINSFSNKIEKEYWVRELAGKLDISEEILFDTFNKANNFQRTSNDNVVKDKTTKTNIFGQSRTKNIQLEVMGLLLANNELWKEIVEKNGERIENYFSNQKIADIILNKGVQAKFNFEKLLDILDNEKQKKVLRELYFNNLEKEKEATIDDKRIELNQYFIELEKENKKKSIKDIIEQIKEAEKNGSKKTVEELAQKLMKLSSENR
ncbi:MAG TPA: DNA primase [Candidatus Moranbacteria bacterium]|nr:DNA primase [Candidatus Moranbacteria bacterium]